MRLRPESRATGLRALLSAYAAAACGVAAGMLVVAPIFAWADRAGARDVDDMAGLSQILLGLLVGPLCGIAVLVAACLYLRVGGLTAVGTCSAAVAAACIGLAGWPDLMWVVLLFAPAIGVALASPRPFRRGLRP